MSGIFRVSVRSAFLALVGAATALAQGGRAGSESGLALQPTRPLKFTTNEGSWISLDLSPDGRTIVFDLLGDLYTMPAGGGKATRITSGQAFDMQPRFSPDGRLIAFVSDRDGSDNLWIANSDGSSPRQISKTEWFAYVSPVWTRDGAGRSVIV